MLKYNIPTIKWPERNTYLYVLKDRKEDKLYLAIRKENEDDIKYKMPIDKEAIEKLKRELTDIWTQRRRHMKCLVDIDRKIGNIELMFDTSRREGQKCVLSLVYYTGKDDDFFGRSIDTYRANLNIQQSRMLYKYINSL